MCISLLYNLNLDGKHFKSKYVIFNLVMFINILLFCYLKTNQPKFVHTML